MDNGVGNNTVHNNQSSIDHNCFNFPGWVSNVPQLPFVFLQVQMLVVFGINQLLHRFLFRHIGMPPLVSQLFAGLALGYTGFGRYKIFHDVLFPPENVPIIKCIILFGYTMVLFVICAQTDFTIIRRTGKKTIIIGLLSLFSALIANIVALQVLTLNDNIKGDVRMAVFSLPATAFPNLVWLANDIGLVNSELGRLALASGMFMEIASILLTMAINNIVPNLENRPKLSQAVVNMSGTAVVLIIVILILRPIMHHLIRLTPKDRPIKDIYLLFAFVTMLLSALLTDYFGQFVFLGAVMVGGALPDGPPLGAALVDKLDTFICGMLLPFFITSAAMKIDVSSINFKGPLVYDLMLLIVVTFVTKLLVCFACGVFNKMARRDALALALILNTKGFLDIGTITWLKDLEGISMECFTVLGFYVIVMAAFVPVIVRLLYDPLRKYAGYQIRDITHLKPNVSLKLVACVFRSDDVSCISNVLEFLSPARNIPITAYIIHLVKLVGRCQPMFISHDMQKRQSLHHSYSEEVIWHFDRLQYCSNSAVSTHIFTALAKVDAMHEYICTLALDKVVSLIVLPFHRKFSIEGFTEIDDHERRLLNLSVLARSPCSVAILVDRSHVNSRRATESTTWPKPITAATQIDEEPLVSMAVIFIGGKDDREALAFARRMSGGMRVKLDVVQLSTCDDGQEFMHSLDAIAINKFLHETRFEDGNINHQVMYVEIPVKDGIETVAKLRSMVHEYDLIIVGRRFNQHCPQTAGLEESCEIKELGILGDFLASPDLKCRTSILVVQQQQHWM